MQFGGWKQADPAAEWTGKWTGDFVSPCARVDSNHCLILRRLTLRADLHRQPRNYAVLPSSAPGRRALRRVGVLLSLLLAADSVQPRSDNVRTLPQPAY
jgi:hypothetical protein